MPTMTRHIGGHPWHSGAPKLPQVTLHVTREEVTALRSQDRLQRLNQEARHGTRFQLLDSRGSKAPVVLITGVDPMAVQEAKVALSVLLHRGMDGLVVPLHLSDLRKLQGTRCEMLAEIEEKSGCRIVLEDHREEVKTDRNIGQKQPFARLLGTQQAQARAVDLLARICQEHVVAETMSSKLAGCGRALVLQTFDPIKRGENIDMTEDHQVARARRTQGCWNPSHCVVAGMGAMDIFNVGAFFCLGIRKVESDRRFRGGTRFGVSPIPVAMPLPDSLLLEPHNCWVLGRGSARSPGGKVQELYGASFDHFQEGDEIGLLVTSQQGSLALLHRPQGRQWTCLVHWDAQIPEPRDSLFMLVDLAGGLTEVEMRIREPPLEPLGNAVSLPHRTPLLDRTQRYPKPRRIQLIPGDEDGNIEPRLTAAPEAQQEPQAPESPPISSPVVRSERLMDNGTDAMAADDEAGESGTREAENSSLPLQAVLEHPMPAEAKQRATPPTTAGESWTGEAENSSLPVQAVLKHPTPTEVQQATEPKPASVNGEVQQATDTSEPAVATSVMQHTNNPEEDLMPTLLGESLVDS
mmetsp:Transcript_120490/g.239808  ORF Transcript_120490/g.239808 Transcript_120490/m.239808 type:complete len:579 (+) Transcript_120490:79-1815(+)